MIPIVSVLLSLAFPVMVIFKYNKGKNVKRAYMNSVASFGFMGYAVLSEIITIKNRLLAGDTGGIEDTIDGVIIICILLIIASIILNFVSLVLAYEE